MSRNPFRPPPGAAPIVAPPPLLFFAFLGMAWGGDTLLPLHPEALSGPTRLGFAAVALGVAVAIGGWGIRTLNQAGTPVEPREITVRLVTTGPYRFSRNPLYLALTALQLFFGLLTGSAWFLAAVPCLFAALHFGVVLREEPYLRGLFPGTYEDYCRKVRRWL